MLSTLIGLIFGFMTGAIVAGLTLMDRRWVVCVRLPEDLHRRLSEEATAHGWSLRARSSLACKRALAQLGRMSSDRSVTTSTTMTWIMTGDA
jgi:HicB-like protein involved in pilus formation